MFGECHAHMIMDGVNYKKAVAQHKDGVVDAVIRQRFEEYTKRGIFFIRDGGDACGVSKRAAQLACEYGITYRTPVFALHKRGHYGGIVGLPFSDFSEYRDRIAQVRTQGGHFIKLMFSGILDFSRGGAMTEAPLQRDEIRELIESKNYAALSDKLDALPADETVNAIRRLPRLFGGEEVLEKAATLCRNREAAQALEYLSRLHQSLCRLGLRDQVMIDLGMVHRNEYYTGVIFRGYVEGSGDAVVSGGRYDTLLQQFGPALPATGFGVNVDALTKVMLDKGEVDPPMAPEALVYAQPGQEVAALKRVNDLIGEGMLCEFSVFDGLEETLAYARERQIPQVFAVGEAGETEIYEI